MRLFKTALLASSLAILSAFFLWFYAASSQIPPSKGEISDLPVQQTTIVQYDDWGTPHIYAQNLSDAYLSLGYIVASHRLTQLVLHRLVAKGKLASLFGSRALKHDIKIRELRMTEYVVDQFLNDDSPAGKKARQLTLAYLDGLNHYIGSHPRPIELVMAGVAVKEFTVEDVLAFTGYLSLSFNEAIRAEILFDHLLQRLPARLHRELQAGYPRDAHHITDQSDSPDTLASKTDIISRSYKQLADTPPRSSTPYLPPSFEVDSFARKIVPTLDGSNSWVVSPHRSQSGHALLANDPHIGVSLPSLFFEAVLITPEWKLNGLYASSVPFAVLGHGPDHGWAMTMSKVDELDFFHEQ